MADAVLPRKQIAVKSEKVGEVQVEDTEETCQRIHLQMRIIAKQAGKRPVNIPKKSHRFCDCLKKNGAGPKVERIYRT